MDKFHEKINSELQTIIDQVIEKEIEATIQYELKGEYSDDEILKHVQYFQENEGFIPEIIKKVEVVASYDMGWNTHITGRVYDSLSGHAFLIGCCSGNVISFGVCTKKCVKCTQAIKLGVDPKPHVCTINHVGLSGSVEANWRYD